MDTKLTRHLKLLSNKELNAQYDIHAKKILSNRYILAYILQRVVEELEGMTIKEIMDCFEGEVSIEHPVMPETIASGNLEDALESEGTIYYDLRFALIHKEKKLKILFDVEAQKDYYPGYHPVTRAVVYSSRMISGQLENEFEIPNYGELKKVYSIWICFNPPKKVGNAISRFTLQQENLLGNIPVKKSDYDKISIVMICLRDDVKNENEPMINLLNTIFTSQNNAEDIVNSLEKDYNIPKDKCFREEVGDMCNLSGMVREQGFIEGKESGRNECKQTYIHALLKKFSAEETAAMLEIPLKEVLEIQNQQ